MFIVADLVSLNDTHLLVFVPCHMGATGFNNEMGGKLYLTEAIRNMYNNYYAI